MNIIRVNRIPLVITLFAILVGAMGTFLGVMALIDPTSAIGFIDGADVMALSWGGRNLGLGVALLAAVALRNASGYTVAFAGSIFREVADIIASLNGDTGFGVTMLAVFVGIEIICLAFSVRAARSDLSVKTG